MNVRRKPKFLVGIDPGSSGSLAVLPTWDFSSVRAYDLNKYDLCTLFMVINELDEVDIFLENPGYMPRDSAKALGMSKLARSVGQLEGIVAATGKTPTLVIPRVWQSTLDCLTNGDKNVTKNMATDLFGKYLRVTHLNADALLIAYYGWSLY